MTMTTDITELLPQRAPLLMVGRLVTAGEQGAETDYCVPRGHFLVEHDCLMEAAFIENIAQSAAAFAGYRARKKGNTAPTGYIGEIKDFRCYGRARVGDVLHTTVTFILDMGDISIAEGRINIGGQKVAEARLAVVLKSGE